MIISGKDVHVQTGKQAFMDQCEKLKSALQDMKETGETGFEGLVACLLSGCTGEQFFISRAGDQPRGDARSSNRLISIQAKRYGSSSPNANEIEGDIRRTLREMPEVAVFVLAVTRSISEQLRDRLDSIQDETGLDIIALDINGEDSGLALLCVEFWDEIRHFDKLNGLGAEFSDWVSRKKAADDFHKKYSELKEAVCSGIASYGKMMEKSSGFLLRRFHRVEDGSAMAGVYEIDLQSAIARNEPTRLFKEWLANGSSKRIFCFVGEEGRGKSWTAAMCVNEILSGEEALVFWFESLDWRNCENVEALLNIGFEKVGVDDERARERMIFKALHIWKKPVLLILDGLNERDALPAANKVFRNFLNREIPRVRFLATTRPIERYQDFDSGLWKGIERVPVDGFSDDELTEALRKEAPPLTRQDMPPSLVGLAKIPRYFKTAISLRQRFGSLGNVSLEMLLWHDLLDRIEKTDWQIREKLGWRSVSDAVEILSEIAQKADIGDPRGSKKAAIELLDRCFDSNYSKVRTDLEELKITVAAGKLEATVSMEHIRLGWALFLLDRLRSLSDSDTLQLANDISAFLEPVPSDDRRTAALFIALQISAIQAEKLGKGIRYKRGALLFKWITSHNARFSEGNLDFWAAEDIDAYACFVEAFFSGLYSEETQLFVVYPLARLWENDGEIATTLVRYLGRWLLLTLPHEADMAKTEMSMGDHVFPIAKNEDQLRLSSVAISLLTLRPDRRLLNHLALCRNTLRLSQKQMGDRMWPLKRLETNIGILVRWSYTENILPELERLASAYSGDELMLGGLRALAESTGAVHVPEILISPPREQIPWFNSVSYIELIKSGQTILPKDKKVPAPMTHDFGRLAARTDLPDLLPEDVDQIKRIMTLLCDQHEIMSRNGRTSEDFSFEKYFPWVAKYSPEFQAELNGTLRLKALDYEHPYWLIHSLSGAANEVEPEINSALVRKCFEIAEEIIKGNRDSESCARQLTEMILFSASGQEVMRWLDLIVTHEDLRTSVNYFPLHYLMRRLLPKEASEHARMRLLEFVNTSRRPSGNQFSDFAFWLEIVACGHGQDKELFNLAKDLLKNNAPDGKDKYYLFMLLAETGPDNWLDEVLSDSKLFALVDKRAFRALQDARRNYPEKLIVTTPYSELMRSLPKVFVGIVLKRTERKEDFKQWGEELMNYACFSVRRIQSKADFIGETRYVLNDEGEIVVIDHESPRKSGWISGATTDTWGIDYSDIEATSKYLNGDFSEEEKQRDKWKEARSIVSSWDNDGISEFSATWLLKRWADDNHAKFIELAERFLDEYLHNTQPLHFGLFTYTVLCVYSHFKPQIALNNYAFFRKNSSIRMSLKTYYNGDAFMDSLWDTAPCSVRERSDVRKTILDNAKNDLEIMYFCLAALEHDAADELWRLISEDFLSSEFAKLRCLGVSVLPWFGDDRATITLERLKENDPNIWVREHAGWALEVVLYEKSCRELYGCALEKSDIVQISAILQRIRPALTPAARVWRRKLEDEKIPGGHIDLRIHALLISFWFHLEIVNRSKIEIFGRNMEEYCRGERMDKMKTSRMAPWWKLD